MERIGGFSKKQMWSAIERLASISSSTASHNQRQLHKAYEGARATSNLTLDPSTDTPSPPIEQLSGTIVDDKS